MEEYYNESYDEGYGYGYDNGYKFGYEQGRERIIEKALEWLKANAENYIVDIGTRDVNLVIGDMCWEDFRKAMDED